MSFTSKHSPAYSQASWFIHDIYLPYNYQRDADRTRYQWMETSILQAFLAFNSCFRIEICLSHLHYDGREALGDVFPEYVAERDTRGWSTGRGITVLLTSRPPPICAAPQQVRVNGLGS